MPFLRGLYLLIPELMLPGGYTESPNVNFFTFTGSKGLHGGEALRVQGTAWWRAPWGEVGYRGSTAALWLRTWTPETNCPGSDLALPLTD